MDIQRILLFCKYIGDIFSHNTVLIGTPEHNNIGDQAITLAEIQILQDLGIHYFEIPSGKFGKWKRKFAFAFPKNYTILYHGGGNLGSIWPEEEYNFRNVLRCFPENRVIVFPQTVYFDLQTDEDKAFLEKSIMIYSAHPKLTIFVREQYSFDFVKKYMPDVDVHMVPDAVMTLNVGNYSLQRDGVLLCLRDDKERTLATDAIEDILFTLKDQLGTIKRTDMMADAFFPLKERENIVRKKLDEFASSELVITDRLHGMVFSALTETPCILLSSKSYKIQGCYKWLEGLGYIHLVENLQDLPREIQNVRGVVPSYNKNHILKEFQPLITALAELK